MKTEVSQNLMPICWGEGQYIRKRGILKFIGDLYWYWIWRNEGNSGWKLNVARRKKTRIVNVGNFWVEIERSPEEDWKIRGNRKSIGKTPDTRKESHEHLLHGFCRGF